MSALSRRAFVGTGVAVLAGASGIGAAAYSATRAPDQTIARFIRHSVPGLAVDEDTLLAFSNRFLERSPWRGNRLRGALLVMDNPELARLMPDKFARAYDWFSRQIITGFLFSTDFFGAAQRRAERTNYVAFADPYEVGCANPLANTSPPA